MPKKFIRRSSFPKNKRCMAKLRERGVDEEAQKELLTWTEAQEARAREINTSRANIEVNVRRAKLYRAAGLIDEAWDVLESVRMQALNEGESDLYDEAMQLMDEIEGSN